MAGKMVGTSMDGCVFVCISGWHCMVQVNVLFGGKWILVQTLIISFYECITEIV